MYDHFDHNFCRIISLRRIGNHFLIRPTPALKVSNHCLSCTPRPQPPASRRLQPWLGQAMMGLGQEMMIWGVTSVWLWMQCWEPPNSSPCEECSLCHDHPFCSPICMPTRYCMHCQLHGAGLIELLFVQVEGISWMVHMFKLGMPMILGDQVCMFT
jgi:hypothetical protein